MPDWLLKLLVPVRRPDPDYAQPSARYLGLIRSGAEEHGLPAAYREWLGSLGTYEATRWPQAVGRAVLVAVFGPAFLLLLALGRVFADDGGRLPLWLAAVAGGIFHLTWWVYDRALRPVFGDGERTEAADSGRPRELHRQGSTGGGPDEKRGLLGFA